MKLLTLCLVLLTGCATIPDGVQPVNNFDVQRYMGKWHEIARIDNTNEAGLSAVTAEYSLLPDGKIAVVNRGFHVRANKWLEAKGVAWFEGGNTKVASLKLSFDNWLTKNYHVLVIDNSYRYALVTGTEREDLWILSRDPQLDQSIIDSLVTKAKVWGFPTERLYMTEQTAKVR